MNAPAIRTSEKGLALTRASEGLELVAYQDSGGVWTIGWGHTGRDVKKGLVISRERAQEYLREDIAEAEATILAYLPESICDELPPEAWDALVDFTFNLGHQAFRNPKNGSLTGIARALEARRYFDVPAQMRRWVYDNGRKLDGLVTRREACAKLWNSADWSKVAR